MSDLRVTDSCELPYGCWELKPSPLEEQSGLLSTHPSLQPRQSDFGLAECMGFVGGSEHCIDVTNGSFRKEMDDRNPFSTVLGR